MKSSGAFKPFQDLKDLLKRKSITLRPVAVNADPCEFETLPDTDDEGKLFTDAMSDVIPIAGNKIIEKKAVVTVPFMEDDPSEQDVLARLTELVESGQGYDVASTSEYLEGVGYQTHPAVTRYLHQGIFSVESHIDLHGYNVSLAKDKFDHFLEAAVKSGKRMVLVVHGRGLSSPGKPVLKTQVLKWLTSGVWRKWIIAFSSARPCDGGAGATYVLLRSRPMSKRHKKRRPRY